jgi:hypothetical protein
MKFGIADCKVPIANFVRVSAAAFSNWQSEIGNRQ